MSSSSIFSSWKPGKWTFHHLIIFGLIGSGFSIVVFDLLRKTIFLQSSWNYHYPARRLVYDPALTGAMVLISILFVFAVPQMLALSRKRFLVTTYGITFLLAALALYVVPLLAADVTSATNDEFSAASVLFIEKGPLEYFSQFHKTGVPTGTQPHLEEAEWVVSLIHSFDFIPGHEYMADYAADLKVQKHGPISLLVVAPFLYLIHQGTSIAILGEYLIMATLPTVAYFVYLQYFPERTSRVGALLVLSAPAYLIYQRTPAAYDVITALFLGLSTFAFLLGVRRRSFSAFATSGIVFSFAALSKITALPILGAFVLYALLTSASKGDLLKKLTAFGIASTVVPISLLFVGYNFLIQYLFTIARQMNQSSMTSTHPAAYLENPILNVISPLYNMRLMGIAMLVLALVFASRFVLFRDLPTEDREIAALSFIVPFLPFVFVLSGLTAARHLLPFIVPLGFIALAGLERLNADSQTTIRLTQAAIAVNLGVGIVGL